MKLALRLSPPMLGLSVAVLLLLPVTTHAVEQQVLTNAGVNLAQLQTYMRQRNLALVVSRNVTTRDDADRQQPFNLRVAGGGTQTTGASGKIYDVRYLQFFQADQLRGLGYLE